MWRIRLETPAIKPDFFSTVENWNQKGVSLLTGDFTIAFSKISAPKNSGAEIFTLAHLWMAHMAMAISGNENQGNLPSRRLPYVVDCAIRFNVFAVSDECLRQGAPVESVLNKIKIRRDFTPYQLLATTREIISNPDYPYVYFFLSPCKQFFDNDVEEEEARFLLKQLVKDFHEMNNKAIPAVLVERPTYRHRVFEEAFPKMASLCCPIWKVNAGREKFFYQQESRLKDLGRVGYIKSLL